MCFAGCGRPGISLSELRPAIETRNLLRSASRTNIVIVEEDASITDEESTPSGLPTLSLSPISSKEVDTTVDSRQEEDSFRQVRLVGEDETSPRACEPQKVESEGHSVRKVSRIEGELDVNTRLLGEDLKHSNKERESLLPAYTSWDKRSHLEKVTNQKKSSDTHKADSTDRGRSKRVNDGEKRRDRCQGRSTRSRSREASNYKSREEKREENRRKPDLLRCNGGNGDVRRRSNDSEKGRYLGREQSNKTKDCSEKERHRAKKRSKSKERYEIKSRERSRSNCGERKKSQNRGRTRRAIQEHGSSGSKELRGAMINERKNFGAGHSELSLASNCLSPIASNREVKSDDNGGGDEVRGIPEPAVTKIGIQWKCKGEVDLERKVLEGFEDQCASNTELAKKESRLPKQEEDDQTIDKCVLLKQQIKTEVKNQSPEVIVIDDDDEHCDNNIVNVLKTQSSEYVEKGTPEDSLEISIKKSGNDNLSNFSPTAELGFPRPDENRRLSISSDPRPQEDENVSDPAEDCFEPRRKKHTSGLKVVDVTSMMPEEQIFGDDVVIQVTGGCICDKFEYRPPSSSWNIFEVICNLHRSFGTKIVGVVTKSTTSHTFLAEVADEDGVVAGRSVKFCPKPPPDSLPGTFVQLRKVHHKKYILLTVDCPWPKAQEAFSFGTYVGLCQVWLGPNVEDLAPSTNISLTCENMESDADGVLSLGCSTSLKPGRPVPFLVVEVEDRLRFQNENRLCSVNKNGMVNLTFRDRPELGSESVMNIKGREIGFISNIIDSAHMEAVIRKVLLSNMNVAKSTPQVPLTSHKKLKTQKSSTRGIGSPKKMKFGVKTTIRVKPASVKPSSIFGDNAETDDDEMCSNSSNASSSQASSKMSNPLTAAAMNKPKSTVNHLVSLAATTQKRPIDASKARNVNRANTAGVSPKNGIAIPTILNTPPVSAIPISPLLLPDLSRPPPSLERSRPDLNMPPPCVTPSQPHQIIKTPHPRIPCPPPQEPSPFPRAQTSAQPSNPSFIVSPCTLCLLNPQFDVKRCPSCPQYTVSLDQDLQLPPDTHVMGKVCVQELNDGQFVKIFSLGGTIHIPDSLNLAFSNNPDATPKRTDGSVTLNFLNTGERDIFLKRGTPVTMAQVLMMSS